MIEGSARRKTGLVRRGPALLLFGGILATALLFSACGRAPQDHRLQGVVLDTGYHLTLHGDLDVPRLEVAIESELVQQAARWTAFGQAMASWRRPGVLPGMSPPSPWPDVLGHAWLVDRLHQRLQGEGLDEFLVEVGGIRRGQGAWWVALPGEDRRLELDDEALASLVWRDAERRQRLSVVADSALEALSLAWRWQAETFPEHAVSWSHPALWVVTTPAGTDERMSGAMATRLGAQEEGADPASGAY
ncbi:hypothetical protein ACFQH5_12645 [Halomonas salifodinae]|uniref:FAD:protein FMN transferase n=1 Tax=Halomonas salifodinae TaxID=438745 RepID=A0ABW2EXE4_9GAMM